MEFSFSQTLFYINNFFLIKVRNFDVPTIVAFGGADFGIVGSDVLAEIDYEEIYTPLDLNIGKCKLVLAKQKKQKNVLDSSGSRIKVATKYPISTQKFFQNKGILLLVLERYSEALICFNRAVELTKDYDKEELEEKKGWS